MAPRILRTERDDSFSVYHAPFDLLPILQHHSHPYYVILNAYLKLQAAGDKDVLPAHKPLLTLANIIHNLWCTLAPQAVAPKPFLKVAWTMIKVLVVIMGVPIPVKVELMAEAAAEKEVIEEKFRRIRSSMR